MNADVRNLCDKLAASAAEVMVQRNVSRNENTEAIMHYSKMLLLELKKSNRQLYVGLEERRAISRTCSLQQDRADLELEAWAYEEQSLRHAISRCKSISSPHLQKLRAGIFEPRDVDDAVVHR